MIIYLDVMAYMFDFFLSTLYHALEQCLIRMLFILVEVVLAFR